MSAIVELAFPVLGPSIPSDHGYALYGAIARVVPAFHDPASPVRIGPIRGVYAGNGVLNLDQRFSSLRLRLPADQIALALSLAGQPLEIAGHRVRLGVPQVRALIPAANLLARLVIIKSSSPFDETTQTRDKSLAKRTLTPTDFLAAAQRKLSALEIAATAAIPLTTDGKFAGQPRRRVMRIKNRAIVGFPLLVEGLTADESVRLQESGLGGRQKMACGFFVPIRS